MNLHVPEASPEGQQTSPENGNRILTIDGPAGAGKSTLAARMAERFRLFNIETGAMYRAFALKALTQGVSLDDEVSLTSLSRHTTIELLPKAGGNRVLLDGEDVTARLRTREISEAASRVSVHGPVRRWMVGLQQELGSGVLPDGARGIVMEGRDVGTVVFPEASLKIFLSASAEARTERRMAQEQDTAVHGTLDMAALLAAMQQRDQRDQSRAESPLRAAADSIEIDSTVLSFEEVAARIEVLVRERWQMPPD